MQQIDDDDIRKNAICDICGKGFILEDMWHKLVDKIRETVRL